MWLLKDSHCSSKMSLFKKTAHVRNPRQIDPSAAQILWLGDCLGYAPCSMCSFGTDLIRNLIHGEPGLGQLIYMAQVTNPGSRRCGCLVTWFCYQMIAKQGNKTATASWPDPYIVVEFQTSHTYTCIQTHISFSHPHYYKTHNNLFNLKFDLHETSCFIWPAYIIGTETRLWSVTEWPCHATERKLFLRDEAIQKEIITGLMYCL